MSWFGKEEKEVPNCKYELESLNQFVYVDTNDELFRPNDLGLTALGIKGLDVKNTKEN